MSAVQKSAIVLLSGGLDFMVVAGLAREAGYAIHALTIDYNQRHRIELEKRGADFRASGSRRAYHIAIASYAFWRLCTDGGHSRAKGWRRGWGDPCHLCPRAQHDFPVAMPRPCRSVRQAASCGSGSMRLIIRVIPIAVPTSSARLKQPPTWRQRRVSRREASPSTPRCCT